MRAAEVELRFWFGVFGPKGMPNDVKAKLEQAVATVMSDPRVRGAPGQARHHTRLRACSGAENQARRRNQELDEVHRQPWDPAGMTRVAERARSRREQRI